MARALIVGCGCRGRALARSLLAAGWQVRGTTRAPARAAEITAVGAEAVVADPERLATLLDHLGDVSVVYWLLASAAGEPDAVRALHDERLESLLRELVNTPVRGVVYEGGGSVPVEQLTRGTGIIEQAAERWRIPSEVVTASPGAPERWTAEMEAAAGRLTEQFG